MKNRNEAFGRLLKAGIASISNCEGKTAAVIEDDLGQAIGVSADTIQRTGRVFQAGTQRVRVVPARDLVVVRLGQTPSDRKPHLTAWLDDVGDCFPDRP